MNKKIKAISLFAIAIFITPLIGSVQASQVNRPNSTPVEITLAAPTVGAYVNFYDAWDYNNKILRAKDLTTASWAATLHTPDEDIPFSSTMILNVLIKMPVNLETYVGELPLVGSWGMAVVKSTWTIEGDVFKGLIIFRYDYVCADYWFPFADEWIPRPGLVECHYFGVLNGPMGQQLVLSGVNAAGEFLVNLEGCLKES